MGEEDKKGQEGMMREEGREGGREGEREGKTERELEGRITSRRQQRHRSRGRPPIGRAVRARSEPLLVR